MMVIACGNTHTSELFCLLAASQDCEQCPAAASTHPEFGSISIKPLRVRNGLTGLKEEGALRMENDR
jgi:hypothetical protein